VRSLAILASALLLASCAGAGSAAPTPVSTVAGPSGPAAPAALPASTPTPTPEIRQYSKLRVFVASESTDSVWVYEAAPAAEFTLLKKIPVARFPHQMAVSPDGRYVAVNDRLANVTSIIDPISMTELMRLPVGKQPHGITFSPDGRTLFVAHERDVYIARFEVGTWKPLPPLMLGVPQHDLTMSRARPNELWFAVTNSSEEDHLRVYDLATNKVTKVVVSDVHDAYFTPDGSEIWSASSGFVDKPSDRMVIYDPVAKTVKQEIHFPGHYPFHTLKPLQDGMYYPVDTSLMVISDHAYPGLMWIDWRERRIVGETKLGQQPFHTTYDPEGKRLLVTTNVDGMVNVIDLATRTVVQKVPVTKAHGIVSVGIP
jgi:YVTN family beta-propeller protein